MNQLKKAGILNLILCILELIGMIVALVNNGLPIMVYFTQESNLLCMIASGIYAWYALVKKPESMPKWVSLFKYITTCLLMVTFIVVIFVFVPMCIPDVGMMINIVFVGASFFHHFVCPILAFIIYVFIEHDMVPGRREVLFAAAPVLVYAIVTGLLNVLRVMEGPYPFLLVHKQPVAISVMWFIVIVGGGYLLALLLRYIKKKRS